MACKNLCVATGYIKTYSIVSALKRIPGISFEAGYKRCSSCQIMLKYDGLFCPCCRQRLKITNRNSRARQRASVDAIRY